MRVANQCDAYKARSARKRTGKASPTNRLSLCIFRTTDAFQAAVGSRNDVAGLTLGANGLVGVASSGASSSTRRTQAQSRSAVRGSTASRLTHTHAGLTCSNARSRPRTTWSLRIAQRLTDVNRVGATTGCDTSGTCLAVGVAIAGLARLHIACSAAALDLTNTHRILPHGQALSVARTVGFVLVAVLHTESCSVPLVNAGKVHFTLALVGSCTVVTDLERAGSFFGKASTCCGCAQEPTSIAGVTACGAGKGITGFATSGVSTTVSSTDRTLHTFC